MSRGQVILVRWVLVMMLFTSMFTPMLVASGAYEEVILERPTEKEEDWPIVSRSYYQRVDLKTGLVVYEHWTITRQAPPGYLPPDRLRCELENATATGGINSTCVYNTSLSREDRERIYSKTEYVEHKILHYVDKYCSSEGCGVKIYYKPYRVKVSWTRSNSNYSVKAAKVYWGCGACVTCDNDNFTDIYSYGPFDPAWYDSTKSWVYVYNRTFPVLEPLPDLGGYVKAESHSDVISGVIIIYWKNRCWCLLPVNYYSRYERHSAKSFLIREKGWVSYQGGENDSIREANQITYYGGPYNPGCFCCFRIFYLVSCGSDGLWGGSGGDHYTGAYRHTCGLYHSSTWDEFRCDPSSHIKG